jgi:ABC-2 type transport system ATP-binding protein
MSEPLLTVTSVRKRFTRVLAVDGLSLEANPGEIVALLGPNGAGKTTLIRMIVGIFRPDEGTIRFARNGASADRPDPASIGYLPEERGLYRDLAVLRTLTYFGVLRGMSRGQAESRSRDWLRRFDLLDRAAEKLEALSKGNQQKVQLIASIVHSPTLAIWDEPFSGLDPVNQEVVLGMLRDLKAEGATVLLSAHQMELVERVADRAIVIHRGREVASGSMDVLRRGGGGAEERLHDLFLRLVREAGENADGTGASA